MAEKELSGKAQAWFERIAQWKASNKSGAAWCQEQGLNYHTFCYWRFQFGKKSKQSTRTLFSELKDPVPTQSGVEIRVRNFSLVLNRDFDPQTLKQCLQVLEQAC